MRGLLLRLSALDPGAESAVRIIAFFDGLAKNRASFEALARATAGLASARAGVRDNSGNVLAYSDAKGRPAQGDSGTAELLERPFGNSQAGGTVWLERADGAQPLDEMILERMAVTADIILDRRRGSEGVLRDDPTLIRALLNPRARDSDRVDAARTLGLRGEVVVLAARLASRDPQRLPQLGHVLEHDLGGSVRVTVIDETRSALVLDAADPEALQAALAAMLSAEDCVGISPPRAAVAADVSWRQAQHALRFAAAGSVAHIARADRLGPLASIAALPLAELADVADVLALQGLADTRGGSDVITTLEQLLATGSVRKVSAALHMHHSSIAYRIERAATALGYPLDNQDGLFRARLAVEMWRLVRFEQQRGATPAARLAD